jgi:hypothetical protein
MYVVTKIFDPSAKWVVRKVVQKMTPVSFTAKFPNGNVVPCLVQFRVLSGKITSFYFGDGSAWDGQGAMEHTYKAAGKFLARAIQKEKDVIDYFDVAITVVDSTTPPKPLPDKTILELIWEFIMRLLGKYTPSGL